MTVNRPPADPFQLERRALIGGGLALLLAPRAGMAAVPTAGVPASGRLGFDVLLKDRKLGTHVVTFRRSADALVIEANVDLAFKLGPLTLYRYNHHAIERWAGGDVASLDAQTSDNGKRYKVTGRRESAGLVVESNAVPRYTAPASALPATHWNHRELEGPWINPQDGKLIRPAVAPRGADSVPTTRGGQLKARRYSVSGPVQMDIWYDEDMQWAGLSANRDGSPLRYVRQG